MAHSPPPWKGTKYDRFWADSIFSGPSAAWFKHKLKVYTYMLFLRGCEIFTRGSLRWA